MHIAWESKNLQQKRQMYRDVLVEIMYYFANKQKGFKKVWHQRCNYRPWNWFAKDDSNKIFGYYKNLRLFRLFLFQSWLSIKEINEFIEP